jgi:hypothetical protein
VEDYECISGDCVNGKCSDPGLALMLNATKNSLIGTDTDSGMMVSLLITLGVTITILFLVRSMAGMAIAIPVFFVMVLFFTLIGWMPPYILIISIFGGLIVVVLAIVLGVNSG